MNTQEPTPMAKRPPIERITYISAEGNPCVFQCDASGRTRMNAVVRLFEAHGKTPKVHNVSPQR